MKLRAVAVFRITAVSVISTMNVERPRERLSLAPMRVKMRSITGRLADSAGTNDPSCARRSEEHTSELQSHVNLVCRLLLEKKKKTTVQSSAVSHIKLKQAS